MNDGCSRRDAGEACLRLTHVRPAQARRSMFRYGARGLP